MRALIFYTFTNTCYFLCYYLYHFTKLSSRGLLIAPLPIPVALAMVINGCPLLLAWVL